MQMKCGVRFRGDLFRAETVESYWEMPYEIEAYGR